MTIEVAFKKVCEICKSFPKTAFGLKSSDPLALEAIRALSTIAVWIQNEGVVPQNWTVKVARGAGSFPRVPWVTILPAGQKTNSGVYVSICFDKTGKGAVCGFAESATHPSGLTTVNRRDNPSWKIDVDGVSKGTRYNNGYVNPKEFYEKSFSSTELLEHIKDSITLCSTHLATLLSTGPSTASVHFVVGRESFSLLAKPFLVLTGNSGTGKTRTAENLARSLSCRDDVRTAVVAVGADWTDNRSVVGYVNHLCSVKTNKRSYPIYQSTPVLDLLLCASGAARAAFPHFLILDEMNLSHVERYFADFLSAMESREGVIRLHDEGPMDEPDYRLPRFEGDPVGVPRNLPYPKNLFVIGTVNVDETTYMFSPKVLDRAHVIEFEVTSNEISSFLDNPGSESPLVPAGAGEAQRFLELSLRARGLRTPVLAYPSDTVKSTTNRHLLDLLDILKRGRFEFAFRTAKEVTTYMKVCRELAPDKEKWDMEEWRSDLDDEILQKILPRLHGSRNRIGPLLGALGCYFHSGDRMEAERFFPTDGAEMPERSLQDVIAIQKDSAAFPRSFSKVKRMVRILIEEQFVSFIC